MYIHIFVICTEMTVSIEESVTTVQDNVSAVIHMRYVYIYVAVPRQGSMSAASANAVLSGHCNIFVGRQPTCMNASHCPEREIIGHVTFQRPHAWLFSVRGKEAGRLSGSFRRYLALFLG